MKRARIVRDDEGAWASATWGKRALGLILSAILGVVLLLPLIVWFLANR